MVGMLETVKNILLAVVMFVTVKNLLVVVPN
jgi:hypothetical protein